MKSIIEALEAKRWEVKTLHDRLMQEWSYGKTIPAPYDTWDEVNDTIENLSDVLSKIDRAIGELFPYRDYTYTR